MINKEMEETQNKEYPYELTDLKGRVWIVFQNPDKTLRVVKK